MLIGAKLLTREEKLAEINSRPELHQHKSFNELRACATNGDAIDLSVFAAHEGVYGGKCDVQSGPCSCGAWH